MKKNKNISVIVPSYNSGRTIEYTINALRRQTCGDLLGEVIVADSSDDGKTREVIRAQEDKLVRMVETGVRVMPGAGRNMGAEKAEGELLAFVDADAYPAPDWLERIWKAYLRGHLIGGGSIEPAPFQKQDPLSMAQYFLQFNSFMPVGGEKDVSFVTSCNLFCEKGLFREMGGFPGTRAAEDVLFCLKNAGGVWFIPQAVVYHIFRDDPVKVYMNQKLLGKYVFIYRKIFYGGILYKSPVPIMLFPAALAVKITRMVFRIVSAGGGRARAFLKSLRFFIKGLFYWSAGYIEGCRGAHAGGDDK